MMAHIQKLGPHRYKVKYRDYSKKSRSKTFKKKIDADRFKTHIENELNNGSWIAPERGRLNFGHYAEIWLSTLDVKPSTIANYRSILSKHILPALGNTEVSKIRWATIEDFKSDLVKSGLNPKTVRNILSVVGPVLTTAVRDGSIATNPAREVAKPRITSIREIRPASAHDILTLTAQMNDHDRLLVTFAAFTGLRAGECGGLQVGDIDFPGRKINVRRSVSEAGGQVQFTSPKNGKSRAVPVPPFLLKQLATHLAALGVSDDLNAQVFRSSRGDTYRHSNFYKRVFAPAIKAAGMDGFWFHHLRHTYASLLIKEGAHPKVIMDRMGHSSIQITMNTYGHLFPSEDEATITGLENAFQEAVSNARGPVGGLTMFSRTA